MNPARPFCAWRCSSRDDEAADSASRSPAQRHFGKVMETPAEVQPTVRRGPIQKDQARVHRRHGSSRAGNVKAAATATHRDRGQTALATVQSQALPHGVRRAHIGTESVGTRALPSDGRGRCGASGSYSLRLRRSGERVLFKRSTASCRRGPRFEVVAAAGRELEIHTAQVERRAARQLSFSTATSRTSRGFVIAAGRGPDVAVTGSRGRR